MGETTRYSSAGSCAPALVSAASLPQQFSTASGASWPGIRKATSSPSLRCQPLRMLSGTRARQTSGAPSWRPSRMQGWRKRSGTRTGTPGGCEGWPQIHLDGRGPDGGCQLVYYSVFTHDHMYVKLRLTNVACRLIKYKCMYVQTT